MRVGANSGFKSPCHWLPQTPRPHLLRTMVWRCMLCRPRAVHAGRGPADSGGRGRAHHAGWRGLASGRVCDRCAAPEPLQQGRQGKHLTACIVGEQCMLAFPGLRINAKAVPACSCAVNARPIQPPRCLPCAGVVAAVKGHALPNGDFEVSDICYAGMPSQAPLPQPTVQPKCDGARAGRGGRGCCKRHAA